MAEREEELLEEGDIVFLYRPKTDEHDPEGLDDVQRFEIAMRPRGGKTRLLAVGKKRLPDVGDHERVWGFVDMVDDAKAVERALREERRETQTRGERVDPAARPAGEGVYAVTLEDGSMRLSYRLEAPERRGEPQKALGLARSASFTLAIKNPEKGQPKNAGLDPERKADYPEKLQEVFRGRRFENEDARLLDHEGAEFVLVGARPDPERAYDFDLDAEAEDYESADAIRRLRLVKSRHPVEPLFEGRWE